MPDRYSGRLTYRTCSSRPCLRGAVIRDRLAKMKAAFFVVLLASAPATAAPLTAPDLMTVAGLTPTSTVADATKLYGPGTPMGGQGVEFLAKGSSSDAWLTFVPDRQV